MNIASIIMGGVLLLACLIPIFVGRAAAARRAQYVLLQRKAELLLAELQELNHDAELAKRRRPHEPMTLTDAYRWWGAADLYRRVTDESVKGIAPVAAAIAVDSKPVSAQGFIWGSAAARPAQRALRSRIVRPKGRIKSGREDIAWQTMDCPQGA